MTRTFTYTFLLLSLFTLGLLPASARSVSAAEAHTEFNARRDIENKGNILNLVFGSAPPLATQRGILLIDSFFDKNDNGRRDAGENDLDQEVFCLIEDIEYTVPAFIPGLAYRSSYKILCAGERYEPAIKREDYFIERRGQIIRVDIPCRKAGGEAALLPPKH
ncbi:MAG TPA: hypothetical protein VD811_15730 [Desulfuromonadales bacterium]|nr:hypothetical protein [Desulfuromonadales bacterium]